MCGLVAISAPDCTLYDLSAGLGTIRHRGPDDQGVFVSNGKDCALGHQRLSILDLTSAGHQPMTDHSGRYALVYNGEVYNFLELRLALEAAHGPIAWRSRGDTEVLLEGYAREGSKFFGKLNGMFAFAIYDRAERETLVFRDPIGIKPLFITRQRGGVFLASELKAFGALGGLTLTLRQESLADMMQFMFIPEPFTFYQEVTKVPPGELLRFRHGTLVGQECIGLEPEAGLGERSEAELVERYSELFAAAVKRQIRSDVPMGIMLSGGIDSSSVALECANAGARLERAFTIETPLAQSRFDMQSPDILYTRRMSEILGTPLEVITANPIMLDTLAQMGPFLDDGIADPAAIASFLIFQRSSELGVKVQMTGHGADEYLCGYRRYPALQALRKLPNWSRPAFSAAARIMPGAIPGKMNASYRRVSRLISLAGKTEADQILDLYSPSRDGYVTSILNIGDDYDPAWALKDLYGRLSNIESNDKLHEIDLAYDLRSLNLVYTDRTSMAFGVEARAPFLDFELVRFMEGLPSEMKLRGTETKYIHKEAFRKRLPRTIISRSKAGFSLPVRSWLTDKSEILDYYLDLERLKTTGLFDMNALSNVVADVRRGHERFSTHVFALLCFLVWHDSV
jgi:asparagine synthase (glutamine-hydrolysing)